MLADAGYGINTAFRTGLTRLGLTYVVGVQSSAQLWSPGSGRSRPRHGAGKVGRRRGCGATRRTSLNRPDNSPNRCRPTPGVTSPGAKASTKLCIPGSPACACGPRIGTTGARNLIRRMADRGMAEGRKRTDQILASDLAGRYRPRDARRNRQNALADRARLSGTQAGTRPRSLRRTRLARLSPPHGALRRAYRFLVSERSLIPPSGDKSCSSKRLVYPRVIDPADPPIPAERHIKASIATIRIKLARSIARRLPRCPCCQRANL